MDWVFGLKQDVRKSPQWKIIQSKIEGRLQSDPNLHTAEEVLRLPEIQEMIADFGQQLRRRIAQENREKGPSAVNDGFRFLLSRLPSAKKKSFLRKHCFFLVLAEEMRRVVWISFLSPKFNKQMGDEGILNSTNKWGTGSSTAKEKKASAASKAVLESGVRGGNREFTTADHNIELNTSVHIPDIPQRLEAELLDQFHTLFIRYFEDREMSPHEMLMIKNLVGPQIMDEAGVDTQSSVRALWSENSEGDRMFFAATVCIEAFGTGLDFNYVRREVFRTLLDIWKKEIKWNNVSSDRILLYLSCCEYVLEQKAQQTQDHDVDGVLRRFCAILLHNSVAEVTKVEVVKGESDKALRADSSQWQKKYSRKTKKRINMIGELYHTLFVGLIPMPVSLYILDQIILFSDSGLRGNNTDMYSIRSRIQKDASGSRETILIELFELVELFTAALILYIVKSRGGVKEADLDLFLHQTLNREDLIRFFRSLTVGEFRKLCENLRGVEYFTQRVSGGSRVKRHFRDDNSRTEDIHRLLVKYVPRHLKFRRTNSGRLRQEMAFEALEVELQDDVVATLTRLQYYSRDTKMPLARRFFHPELEYQVYPNDSVQEIAYSLSDDGSFEMETQNRQELCDDAQMLEKSAYAFTTSQNFAKYVDFIYKKHGDIRDDRKLALVFFCGQVGRVYFRIPVSRMCFDAEDRGNVIVPKPLGESSEGDDEGSPGAEQSGGGSSPSSWRHGSSPFSTRAGQTTLPASIGGSPRERHQEKQEKGPKQPKKKQKSYKADFPFRASLIDALCRGVHRLQLGNEILERNIVADCIMQARIRHDLT